jgi:hypothetical protein
MAPTLVLLLAIVPATATQAHRSRPSKCPPAQGHVLLADSQARVYEGSLENIFGCVRGQNSLQLLGPVPKSSSGGGSGVELETLAGPVVAYTKFLVADREAEPGFWSYRIMVRNLRTNKVLHNSPTGTSTTSKSNQFVGIGPALDIVVKRNGAVAWIAENSEKSVGGSIYYEMHAVDGSENRLLASGAEIGPKSLALVGSILYWTQGGKPMSAPLE